MTGRCGPVPLCHALWLSGLSPGYPQIGARDNAIAGLGAVLCGARHLQATFRAALDTLGADPAAVLLGL